MKTNLFTTILVFLFHCSVQAQIEVTITKLDGSTFSTTIDKTSWEAIRVLKTAGDNKIPYEDFLSVRVGNRKYEILHFEKPIKKTNIKDIDSPILTEVLVDGTIELFAYQKNPKEVKYFIRKDDEISILEIEEYFKDGRAYAKKYYLGILMIYLKDCPDISPLEIGKCNYDSKDLKNLIAKYNKSCGTIISISEKKPVQFTVYPSFGYKFFSSEFSSNKYLQGEAQNFNYPYVGAGVRFEVIKKPNIYLTTNFATDGFATYFDSTFNTRASWPYDSFYFSRRFDVSYFNVNVGIGTTYEFDNGLKLLFEYLVDFRNVLKVKTNQAYYRRESRIFGNEESRYPAMNTSSFASLNFNSKFQFGIHWKSIELMTFYQFGPGGITNSNIESSKNFGAEIRYCIDLNL